MFTTTLSQFLRELITNFGALSSRIWKSQEDSFDSSFFLPDHCKSSHPRHLPTLNESLNNSQNRSRISRVRSASGFRLPYEGGKAPKGNSEEEGGESQIGGELFHDSSDDVRARIRRETMEGWICQSVLCSHYTNPSDRFPAPFSLLSSSSSSSSSLGEHDSRA